MKELVTIQERLKAPKGQYNSFGKYKYRSAEDILEAVKPILTSCDCHLTISDDVVIVGNRVYIKAIAVLTNSKGEQVMTTAFAREEETNKSMDASQITGATSSYARKYALNGLFCIDDTKDADTMDNREDDFTKAKGEIDAANSVQELTVIFNKYQSLHSNNDFMACLTNRKKQLS